MGYPRALSCPSETAFKVENHGPNGGNKPALDRVFEPPVGHDFRDFARSGCSGKKAGVEGKQTCAAFGSRASPNSLFNFVDLLPNTSLGVCTGGVFGIAVIGFGVVGFCVRPGDSLLNWFDVMLGLSIICCTMAPLYGFSF